MIPPRVLKQLAETLTEQTRAGIVKWSRQRHDVQRYTHQLKSGQIIMYYNPSRGGADTIELAVTDDPGGEVIGSLVAQESEPAYDVLADLLFEIQRTSGQDPHRAVTDEILRLLKT